MSASPKRQKMCWHCEGNVPLEAEDCPYCQNSLVPAEERSVDPILNAFAPPYSHRAISAQETAPTSPFSYLEQQQFPPHDKAVSLPHEPIAEAVGHKSIHSELKLAVITMAMLMGGLVLFLFGWVLGLFSSDGYLVLRWNSSYWLLYLLVGAGMLYMGFRKLGQFEDDEEF